MKILMRGAAAAVARYALEGLPSRIMAAHYRTALPDETLLATELDKARKLIESRQSRRIARSNR